MTPNTETLLEDLERAVIFGRRALLQRNQVLVQLADQGHTGASLHRRLNIVRAEEGAEPLTPDAVQVAIRRGRKART